MAPKRRASATDDGAKETDHATPAGAPVDDLDAERQERMARNAAALAAIGVAKAVRNFTQAVAAEKNNHRGPASAAQRIAAKRPRVVERRLPPRRSHRIAGMPAPNLVELDDDGNPMYSGGGSAEGDGSGDGEEAAGGTHGGELLDLIGLTCHFCRQKMLCSEEDCPRCSTRNSAAQCLGKSTCSSCKSATGIFCRACLWVRYGQVLEEVREDPDWLCPHCYEKKHGNWRKHGWFCNSSICMRKEGRLPTGIAFHKAQERGYASVAHMLQAAVLNMAEEGATGAKQRGGDAAGHTGADGSKEEEEAGKTPQTGGSGGKQGAAAALGKAVAALDDGGVEVG
ncbi:hypothetical protein VOLCADRAFT_121447 [Volvox carteri f. nagariensis]|uniref:Zinc-finger domain-containing protein n=1 Tax=Volvox carteri f. nagariensis TaxID=3068 RepID=D8UAL2_VOLCA|nr:uncharacterized protein VOLCADRAFT_121447 [Volvox carteri f. nagariensis]EFJ43342.1 hypothetical protein VOLCADRAFT_121447 [Volvox carteri f. nagariensis]|eukprot:XP_002955702.1 hypothetical protein VOLCADRAFT_121447 [Volvox carteri f. nagariensis]